MTQRIPRRVRRRRQLMRQSEAEQMRIAYLKGATVLQTLTRVLQFYADNAKPEQEE